MFSFALGIVLISYFSELQVIFKMLRRFLILNNHTTRIDQPFNKVAVLILNFFLIKLLKAGMFMDNFFLFMDLWGESPVAFAGKN